MVVVSLLIMGEQNVTHTNSMKSLKHRDNLGGLYIILVTIHVSVHIICCVMMASNFVVMFVHVLQ